MGKFFNKVFRFNRHRQEAIEQQRRINNLVLLLIVTVSVLVLACLIATGPERLPGT